MRVNKAACCVRSGLMSIGADWRCMETTILMHVCSATPSPAWPFTGIVRVSEFKDQTHRQTDQARRADDEDDYR